MSLIPVTDRGPLEEGIRIIRQRDLIRRVPHLWRHYRAGRQPQQSQLDKLDLETCSPQDITRITGSSTWTMLSCSHCNNEQCEFVIAVPLESSRGAACFCVECLFKMFVLLETKS